MSKQKENQQQKQSPASKSPNTSSIQETDSNTEAEKAPATPLRCFTGALTAGTFSLLAYRLTLSIATSFANKPVISSNPAVVNISAAVRTLVTGMVALGACVFGIAALGLAALGIQLLFTKQPNPAPEATPDESS